MMTLDRFNSLDNWPLRGLTEFIQECQKRKIKEVNLTGTNTDPLLFQHHNSLEKTLIKAIPGVKLGIRTNGALILSKPEVWKLYDKASITFPSFNKDIYTKQMGKGSVPDLERILSLDGPKSIKINIVLGEELTDLEDTLNRLSDLNIQKVNLREPYGQPHIGNPLKDLMPVRRVYGMPLYIWKGMEVLYWDVHYVHVESVNLYANGRISIEYPITKGHDKTGTVHEQWHWKTKGRHVEQWQKPL